MNQPTKPDSIETECRANCDICFDEVGNEWPCAKRRAAADRAARQPVAGSVDTDDKLRRLLWALSCTTGRENAEVEQKIIAHINTLIAAERIEGRRDAHETNVVLVNENDKLREKLALITPAAPSEEAVAQVDEGDDGLFIEIIYGPDGSDLKRGDKLYTRPAPRDVDAPIVLPPKPEPDITYEDGKDEWGYTAHSCAHSDDALTTYATAAVQKDRADQKGHAK